LVFKMFKRLMMFKVRLITLVFSPAASHPAPADPAGTAGTAGAPGAREEPGVREEPSAREEMATICAEVPGTVVA
jgi:hypothetical protein